MVWSDFLSLHFGVSHRRPWPGVLTQSLVRHWQCRSYWYSAEGNESASMLSVLSCSWRWCKQDHHGTMIAVSCWAIVTHSWSSLISQDSYLWIVVEGFSEIRAEMGRQRKGLDRWWAQITVRRTADWLAWSPFPSGSLGLALGLSLHFEGSQPKCSQESLHETGHKQGGMSGAQSAMCKQIRGHHSLSGRDQSLLEFQAVWTSGHCR